VVTGCGTPPKAETTPPTPPPPTASIAAPAPAIAPVPAIGAYEVHEWGVVDVPVAGPLEIAAGPGAPSNEPPRPVKKPVLYFHLDPGAAPLEVDVTARIPHGSMLEVWPDGRLERDTIRWPHVRVGACPRGELPTAVTPQRESGWPSRDGFHEVFDLPSYQTDDSACLTSGDTPARLLFYRGAVEQTRLPIELTRDGDGHVALRTSATNSSTIFLTKAGGGGTPLPWPSAASDGAVPLVQPTTAALDGVRLRDLLNAQIQSAGLTKSEAAAFLNAWSEPFFGVPAATKPTAATAGRDRTAPACAAQLEGPPASLIYVMPAASVNDVASLTLIPAPRVLRRVMVVRLELPGL
jgi:hypothetical protein